MAASIRCQQYLRAKSSSVLAFVKYGGPGVSPGPFVLFPVPIRFASSVDSQPLDIDS